MKMYTATIRKDALKVKSRQAYYTGQKRLFIFVVIVFSVVPLLGISHLSFHYYKKSWIEKTSQQLQSIAKSRQEIIDNFLNNQEYLLAGVIDLYSMQYLIKPGNLEKVFTAINRNGVIVDLGIIDKSGAHRAYTGPYSKQLLDKNYLDAEWFREAMRKNKFVSDIFRGFRNEPHFVVAVTGPEKNWILRATINSELFNALLAGSEVGAGGDAFIINRKGQMQTPSRLGATELPAGKFEKIRSMSGPSVYQEDNFIYATSEIKNEDWTLVLKTDINSSLAEFNRSKKQAILFTCFAGIVITAVATLLIRSMVNRIESADNQRMGINNRMLEVEKMALIGRIAASVAHEINNPLQIIDDQAGWIGELLEEEKNSALVNMAEYRESAKKIRSHVKRAKTITHKLLGFSRSGDAEKVETDMNLLVEESVSFLEHEAQNHQIIVRRNLDAALPRVITDPSQLQQVFINIINNAIEAIGMDGVITISTRPLESGGIAVEFADSGPGMAAEVQKKIFDPFFSTKKGGRNTGLGMSISFNIIQRLGGELEVKNGTSGGCVFTVRMQAA